MLLCRVHTCLRSPVWEARIAAGQVGYRTWVVGGQLGLPHAVCVLNLSAGAGASPSAFIIASSRLVRRDDYYHPDSPPRRRADKRRSTQSAAACLSGILPGAPPKARSRQAPTQRMVGSRLRPLTPDA